MNMNLPKTAAIILVLLLLSLCPLSSAGETSHFSDEVLAAKSIAVIVQFVDPWGTEPDGFRERMRTLAERKIKQKGHFQIVGDPSQADLVCLFVMHNPRWFYHKDPQKYHSGALGSSVVILKGGASTHWDAIPVWMQSQPALSAVAWPDHPKYLIGKFHDALERAEKAHLQHRDSESAHPENTVDQRPTTSPVADEKNISFMCLDDCPKNTAGAIRTLAHRPGWNFIDGPAPSDLVAVWFDVDMMSMGAIGRVQMMNTVRFGALLVFKGDKPNWSATPFMAATGRGAAYLFQRFVNSLPDN